MCVNDENEMRAATMGNDATCQQQSIYFPPSPYGRRSFSTKEQKAAASKPYKQRHSQPRNVQVQAEALLEYFGKLCKIILSLL